MIDFSAAEKRIQELGWDGIGFVQLEDKTWVATAVKAGLAGPALPTGSGSDREEAVAHLLSDPRLNG